MPGSCGTWGCSVLSAGWGDRGNVRLFSVQDTGAGLCLGGDGVDGAVGLGIANLFTTRGLFPAESFRPPTSSDQHIFFSCSSFTLLFRHRFWLIHETRVKV